jgi:1-acyl-sn-glycerol-3-phosphate acyltransferase
LNRLPIWRRSICVWVDRGHAAASVEADLAERRCGAMRLLMWQTVCATLQLGLYRHCPLALTALHFFAKRRAMIEKLFGLVLCNFAKLLTGVHPLWQNCKPEAKLRVYFANHRSHGDFVVIWAALPAELRRQTRPVAGADYWLDSRFKSWLISKVFHAVLVDRRPGREGPDPVEQMAGALQCRQLLDSVPRGHAQYLASRYCPSRAGSSILRKRCRRWSWCRRGSRTSAG